MESGDMLLCCTWGEQGAVAFEPGSKKMAEVTSVRLPDQPVVE